MKRALVDRVVAEVAETGALEAFILKGEGETKAERGLAAHDPVTAPNPVGLFARQLSETEGFTGVFTKNRFAGHVRPTKLSGASAVKARCHKARRQSASLGARWKAIQRTPHRKVALPVGVREREPGTIFACSRAADPRDDLLTLRDGLPAAIADLPVTGNDPDIDCSGSWQAALVQLLPDSLASAA